MTQAMSTHLGEVVPVIGGYWERAEIPWPLVRRLPELGIVGEDIQGYGCVTALRHGLCVGSEAPALDVE